MQASSKIDQETACYFKQFLSLFQLAKHKFDSNSQNLFLLPACLLVRSSLWLLSSLINIIGLVFAEHVCIERLVTCDECVEVWAELVSQNLEDHGEHREWDQIAGKSGHYFGCNVNKYYKCPCAACLAIIRFAFCI